MRKNAKINKQYGLVYKKVLLNKNILFNVKDLYIYLRARSGNKKIQSNY